MNATLFITCPVSVPYLKEKMIYITLCICLLPLYLNAGLSTRRLLLPITAEFMSTLRGMNGPEDSVIRKKILSVMVHKEKFDTVTCPKIWHRILIDEFNCTNSSHGLLPYIKKNDFHWLFNSNVTFANSFLEGNCTLLSGRDAWLCHESLTGGIVNVDNLNFPQIPDKCFSEYVGKSETFLSFR